MPRPGAPRHRNLTRAPATQYRLAMTTVPPGWYDDGHGGMRWWDGTRWTEHVAPPETAEPPSPDALTSASPYWGGEPEADRPHPVAAVPSGEPRRPRPWIAWVVFGAVGLGLVLAFAFGSQLVLPKGDNAPAEASEESAAEEPTVDQPAADQPDTPDEQAAVDAVLLFNEAWLTGDCPAFFATTTADFRAESEIPDCAAFADASRRFRRLGRRLRNVHPQRRDRSAWRSRCRRPRRTRAPTMTTATTPGSLSTTRIGASTGCPGPMREAGRSTPSPTSES